MLIYLYVPPQNSRDGKNITGCLIEGIENYCSEYGLTSWVAHYRSVSPPLLYRLLLASGYQPVTYHSAEVFLDDAKQPVFDCLIVDIQLGGMSGLELGERLARDGSNIPLIFLTAHENWETLKQSISTPYVVLLHKNDPGETVINAIGSSMANTNH